jgi:hypothetical protein
MTSKNTFPKLLTKIDDLYREDHTYLKEDDECYFLGEYTARKGYTYSATNSLILNLKKDLETKGTSQWRYKESAIKEAAASFSNAINPEFLDKTTFVPIPPSKSKTDPLYDDRITKLIQAIRLDPPLDVRELVVQVESTTPAHATDYRMNPTELERLYKMDQNLLKPHPNNVVLVDDVLTTGAHFRAAKSIISNHFKGIHIIGLFVARRVPETIDPGGVF